MIRKTLTSALAAVASIASFASPMASGDICHLEWDIPCCPIDGSDLGMATMIFTICNCTDQPSEYEFTLKSNNQDISFDPPIGVVGLLPGECIDIPITILCPLQTTQDMRLIEANVVNIATGNQFECAGSLRPAETTKINPPDPVLDVVVGREVDAPLFVQNLISGPNVVTISASSMSPEVTILTQPGPVEFDGPGMQMTSLRAVINATTVKRGSANEVQFYDVLLTYDATGDGVAEVNSSVTLRVGLAGCEADLNGDGAVGSDDLAALLGSWGPCP